jgi:hypothetical protein
VTCITFGCYRAGYVARSLKGGKIWDPWMPSVLAEGDFDVKSLPSRTDAQAHADLLASLAKL